MNLRVLITELTLINDTLLHKTLQNQSSGRGALNKNQRLSIKICIIFVLFLVFG